MIAINKELLLFPFSFLEVTFPCRSSRFPFFTLCCCFPMRKRAHHHAPSGVACCALQGYMHTCMYTYTIHVYTITLFTLLQVLLSSPTQAKCSWSGALPTAVSGCYPSSACGIYMYIICMYACMCSPYYEVFKIYTRSFLLSQFRVDSFLDTPLLSLPHH